MLLLKKSLSLIFCPGWWSADWATRYWTLVSQLPPLECLDYGSLDKQLAFMNVVLGMESRASSMLGWPPTNCKGESTKRKDKICNKSIDRMFNVVFFSMTLNNLLKRDRKDMHVIPALGSWGRMIRYPEKTTLSRLSACENKQPHNNLNDGMKSTYKGLWSLTGKCLVKDLYLPGRLVTSWPLMKSSTSSGCRWYCPSGFAFLVAILARSILEPRKLKEEKLFKK